MAVEEGIKRMKVTYEQVYGFLITSQRWLDSNESHAKTKLGYAIQKIRPRAEKLWAKYQNHLEDIDIDNCFVDDKGVIQKEGNGYKFTKDGAKAAKVAREKLLESEVEIEPHYATSLVGTELSTSQQLAFIGFVLESEVQEVDREAVGAAT